jgi:hypothetical protein
MVENFWKHCQSSISFPLINNGVDHVDDSQPDLPPLLQGSSRGDAQPSAWLMGQPPNRLRSELNSALIAALAKHGEAHAS